MIEAKKSGLIKHFNRICGKFFEERENQLEEWGVQHHSIYKWLTILMQEVGDASDHALKMNITEFGEQIVQIGAVAIAILEDLYDTYPNEYSEQKEENNEVNKVLEEADHDED